MIMSQYYLPRRRKQQKRVFVPVAMILHNITGTLEVDAQSGVDQWSVSTAPAEIMLSLQEG